MNHPNRIFAILRYCGFAGLLLAGLVSQTSAQEWPGKPIKFIWPYAPGAANGNVARLVMEETGKLLGQPIVTEYKAGAGGRFGVAEVSKQRRDDYLVAGVQEVVLTLLPHATTTFKAELRKDYRPLLVTHELQMLLTAYAKLPFDDMKGLIAYAKANPGKLTFGSSGVGGTSHILSERLFTAAGVKATHIPYKGNAQALADRLSGTVDLYVESSQSKPYVDSGQLKVIATGGAERHPSFPNVPTLRESGVDVVLVSWGGLVVPAQTPDEIVMKLNKAVNAVLARPNIKQAYADIGYRARGGTPEEMEERISSETAAYLPIIKSLGISFE